MRADRILLGQLGANGDCLYATILARQLRHDYPDAHIVWAISSLCKSALRNNSDINEIWEIPVFGWEQQEAAWRVFEREAIHRYQRGEFDRILLSQIWPQHFENYDGTVRPSILRSYGRPITVPIENVIDLDEEELQNVSRFVTDNRIPERKHRILFECSAKSGQSFVTPDLAQEIADHLYGMLSDATVIFSTHLPMQLRDKRSLYAGDLSLRETAGLTHSCSLFVGAGSGGTVVASSSASAKLPMIILLSGSTSVFASFAHDFEYFGIEDRQIFEITNEDPRYLAKYIASVCECGPAGVEASESRVPVVFDHYLALIESCLLQRNRYIDAARSLMTTADRYGWTKELIEFGQNRINPHLRIDPGWMFAHNRRVAEQLNSQISSAVLNPVPKPIQKKYKATSRTKFLGDA